MNLLHPFPRSVALLCVISSLLLGGTACSAKAKGERYIKRADTFFEKGDYERARIEYLNAFRLNKNNAHVAARLGTSNLELGRFQEAFEFLTRAKQLQSTNVDARAKLASLYLLDRQLPQARAEAESILKTAPLNGPALGILAGSSTNAADRAATFDRLKQLAASNPNNADVHMALGLIAQESRDLNTADAAFSRALQINPQNSKAHLALARLKIARGDLSGGESSLKAASDLAEPKSPENMAYAELLMKTGREAEAKALLTKLTGKAPNFVAGWNMLTQIALSQKDTNSASAYVSKALAVDGDNRDALLYRSKLKMISRQFESASSDLQKLSQVHPRDSEVKYQLAVSQLGLNEPEKALATLENALTLNTNNVDAVVLKAQLLAARGNLARQIPELTRTAQRFPKIAQVSYLLASAHRQAGAPAEALNVYKRIAEANPQDPQPLFYAAGIYREQRKMADARAAYEAALKVNPDFAPALDDLIELDVMENRHAEALVRIGGYITKYPDKPLPRLLQGKVLFYQKKYDEAESALEKAIELDPEFQLAHRSLADLYRATGKTDQAIAKLESMVEKNPRYVGGKVLLATLYEQGGNLEKARKAYEAVLELQPNSLVALNNLAYMLSERTGDIDAALVHARKAREIAPGDAAIADTLGWILFKKGDYAQAQPLIVQASDGVLGNNPEVQYHLGMTQYMLGNREAAAASLQRAVSSTNSFPGKDKAQTVLASLSVKNPSGEASKGASPAALESVLRDNPGDLRAAQQLGRHYEDNSQPEKARAIYEAALAKNPNSAPLLAQMASLYASKLNDPRRGLDLARKAWSISKTPTLAASLGPVAYLGGDFKMADSLLLEALRLDANNPDLLYYSGLSSYAIGRVPRARETLARAAQSTSLSEQKSGLSKAAVQLVGLHDGSTTAEQAQGAIVAARRIDPQFPAASVAAGLLAEQKGDFQSARREYESALKAHPGLLIAQRQLAILLAEKLPDDATAFQLASPLRTEFVQDHQLTAVLGKLAYRRGDYAEAARLLKVVVAAEPGNADLVYHLGLAQFHAKDTGAKATLTRALSLEANGRLTADAKKALAELK